MVSPLKGLTRAQITARAALRRAAEAAEAAKKGKRTKKTTTTAKGRIRVSQATVNRVSTLGRTKARAAAAKPGASEEFKEAVRRYYPTRRKTKR